MTNNIQVFNYEANEIRTVQHDNDVWFVAKDVCDVLGYANPRKAIADHIDNDEKGVTICDTPGGSQEMTIINESGLYTLILRSNKPNAKAFRKWVTGTVLPSIRKTGFYATHDTAQRILEDPDTFINVLKAYKEQKARNAQLEAQALGYSADSNLAILFANVPAIWKGVKPFHTPGGEQEMLCLNVSLIKDFEHC